MSTETKSNPEDGWLPEDYIPPSEHLRDLVVGYPRLAGKMEISPVLSIFRRFGALNARMLLYMQCELSTLEKDLKERETLDNASDEGKKKRYSKDAWWLMNACEDRDGDTEQLNLILEIKSKLKEYNEALLLQQRILAMKSPDPSDIRYMQDLLQHASMGPLALIGDDALVWGTASKSKDHAADLITLRPRHEADFFSKWLAANAIKVITKCGVSRWWKNDPVNGTFSYTDSSIFRITFWIASILASLLPLLFLATLQHPSLHMSRMGTIIACNVLLSACLGLFTEARKVDIFAVIAVYTFSHVVLVVMDEC